MLVQLIFLIIIFYLAILALRKGLLLVLIFGTTLILGRLFCGWICPFGLYMDLITLIRKTLKISHWTLPKKINDGCNALRYLIALIILVLVIMPFLMGTISSFNF